MNASKRVLFVYRNAEWMGIEYLSSALKKAGHTTDLIFDPGVGDIEFKINFLSKHLDFKDRMIQKAKEFKPDLIAFSSLTNQYPWVSKMAKTLRKEFSVPFIIGGIHPSFFPTQVMEDDLFDVVCIGEGEEAIVELVDSLDDIDYSIKNLWFKKMDGEIIKNEKRPLIQNLDDLAFPDKEIFYQYGCFRDRIYIMTGRGCPFKCTYCFNHAYKELYKNLGKYVRQRSVESVIEELKTYKRKYRVKEVFFYDDVFTLNHKWFEQFCEIYKREIRLPYKCMVRANTLNEDVARMLKDSGCIYVDIGVESGSETVANEIMKRGMSNKQIIDGCKLLRDQGIKFCTLNIVGVPEETVDQMYETLELNRILKPSGVLANVFYPFPGTELYNFSIEKGYLDEEIADKIKKGEGSYREGTILNHPNRKEIQWYNTFMPIAVRLPKYCDAFLFKLPSLKIFRLISIFFATHPRNLFIRVKELVESIFFSIAAYKKYSK